MSELQDPKVNPALEGDRRVDDKPAPEGRPGGSGGQGSASDKGRDPSVVENSRPVD